MSGGAEEVFGARGGRFAGRRWVMLDVGYNPLNLAWRINFFINGGQE